MSVLSSLARPVQELLLRRLSTTHDVRALLVADHSGLPLVSTLSSGPLEEALAAFAGLIQSSARFADQELKLGGFHYQHVAGRDRHVFLAFLSREEVLVAITNVTATPGNVITMLSGTAVEIMNLVADARYLQEEGSPLEEVTNGT